VAVLYASTSCLLKVPASKLSSLIPNDTSSPTIRRIGQKDSARFLLGSTLHLPSLLLRIIWFRERSVDRLLFCIRLPFKDFCSSSVRSTFSRRPQWSAYSTEKLVPSVSYFCDPSPIAIGVCNFCVVNLLFCFVSGLLSLLSFAFICDCCMTARNCYYLQFMLSHEFHELIFLMVWLMKGNLGLGLVDRVGRMSEMVHMMMALGCFSAWTGSDTIGTMYKYSIQFIMPTMI